MSATLLLGCDPSDAENRESPADEAASANGGKEDSATCTPDRLYAGIYGGDGNRYSYGAAFRDGEETVRVTLTDTCDSNIGLDLQKTMEGVQVDISGTPGIMTRWDTSDGRVQLAELVYPDETWALWLWHSGFNGSRWIELNPVSDERPVGSECNPVDPSRCEDS